MEREGYGGCWAEAKVEWRIEANTASLSRSLVLRGTSLEALVIFGLLRHRVAVCSCVRLPICYLALS